MLLGQRQFELSLGIILCLSKQLTHTVMVRHKAKNLRDEGRRKDVSTSEVVLAFPILDAQVDSQKTFAFLPIQRFWIQSQSP